MGYLFFEPKQPMRSLGLGLGFWVLGFGFWALGFGFWVLGFGFWVLGFGFWVLGFGFWVLGCLKFSKVLRGCGFGM